MTIITLFIIFMAYYVTDAENRCPNYDSSGNQCSHGCCWRRSGNSYCCSWAESVGDVVLALIGVGSSLAVVTIIVFIICCCVKSKGHPGEIISSPEQSRLWTASGSQIVSRNNTTNVIPENSTHNYRPSINRNSPSVPRENITSQSVLIGITRNVASGASNSISVPSGNRSANLPTISENVSDTETPPAYNTTIQPQMIDITEPPPSYYSLFKGETTANRF